MPYGKDMITHSIAGLMKKTLHFPKPCKPFGGNVKLELDLFSYATKADLKDATGIDTSNLALKSNLASLKTEVDKLDTDKLVSIPVYISKLSDVVKNDVVKKTVYKKLVTKINSIYTSEFFQKLNTIQINQT